MADKRWDSDGRAQEKASVQVENDKLCAAMPVISEVHSFNVALEGKKKKKARRNTIPYFGTILLERNYYLFFANTSSILLSLSSLY